MASGARLARLGIALFGLSFASCFIDGAFGDEHGVDRSTRGVARLAKAESVRLKSSPIDADQGRWPEPNPDEVAELTRESGEVQPASAKSGDVLAQDESGADDGAELDAPSSPITSDAPVDPDRALAAIAKETFVYASPNYRAKKVGYLRGGAIVQRSPRAVGDAGCAGGWYRIAPFGFVCVGKHATLDVHHPLVTAAVRRPDRGAALPYAYGMSLFPTPPFYTRIPSERQQASVEQDLVGHLRQKLDPGWNDITFDAVPELLAGGRQLTNWSGLTHGPGSVYTGRALPKSGFAFLNLFESEGRKFGLTVDLDVVPLDRMRRVEPSTFHGIQLDDQTTLPIAFVMQKGAQLYDGDPQKGGTKPVRAFEYREAVPITTKRVSVSGVSWLETKTGQWLRDEGVVKVMPMKNRPGWATPGRTWIDVSILKQALIAYEGTKPVYVTLVSTGADGLGDPKETHSTIRGQYLIHTKHVTATMSGDELGDEFDLRDVPYVQYFMDGYALHAAYWHDSFGRPRSHGCVNLAPIDARWLFHWTDPPVPQGWHGAMSLHEGTLVHVHP